MDIAHLFAILFFQVTNNSKILCCPFHIPFKANLINQTVFSYFHLENELIHGHSCTLIKTVGNPYLQIIFLFHIILITNSRLTGDSI